MNITIHLTLLNKLICKIKGHDLSFAYFLNACYSYTPPSASIDYLNNKIHFVNPIKYGFIHHGLVSKCNRCEEIIDIDQESTDLPIVYPDGEIFIKSTRANNDQTTKTKHIR